MVHLLFGSRVGHSRLGVNVVAFFTPHIDVCLVPHTLSASDLQGMAQTCVLALHGVPPRECQYPNPILELDGPFLHTCS